MLYYSEYRGLEMVIKSRFMIYNGTIWAPAHNSN